MSILQRVFLVLITAVLVTHTALVAALCNGSLLELIAFDAQRVSTFLHEYQKATLRFRLQVRSQILDERIQAADLNLADKIEAFKRLSPSADATGSRTELRMERLLLSIDPDDLSAFKFTLEYDGDYKDLVEYLFHDIDDRSRQERILKHFRKTQIQIANSIKVLSDVDDTLYANLIDQRYPKKTLYPGILEFYAALSQEPFELSATPITALSARPNPIAGVLEEDSLKSLVTLTKGRLCPSALSGALVSSSVGTIQSLIREKTDALADQVPHGQEEQIGIVKFENFLEFSAIYPEYHYVFMGDSGQADALTAEKMLSIDTNEARARVITTFIHDLRDSANATKSASPSFKNLGQNLGTDVVLPTSASGRGVIVHRNYIAAAVAAYQHAETLNHLVNLTELAQITRAALAQFTEIDFQDKKASAKNLKQQYREDAEQAYALLTSADSAGSAVTDNLTEIRRLLDEKFRQ